MPSFGTQTMTEFCEQVNPQLLYEIRKRDQPRAQESRVQESWTAVPEKRALIWLAGHVPSWIGPDHLTALGLAAQIGASPNDAREYRRIVQPELIVRASCSPVL